MAEVMKKAILKNACGRFRLIYSKQCLRSCCQAIELLSNCFEKTYALLCDKRIYQGGYYADTYGKPGTLKPLPHH